MNLFLVISTQDTDIKHLGTFSLTRFISGDDEKQTWSGAQQSCHDEDSEMLIIDQTNERDWVATRSGVSVCVLLLTIVYM